MKNIYLIRHCEAEGQPSESKLTKSGLLQAKELADFLLPFKVDQIISSPFLRAVQTIEPFAKVKSLEISIDARLSERVLSSKNLPDWLDKLKATFKDMDLKYEGGESSGEALNRILQVVNMVRVNDVENIIMITHGNILSLLLNYYSNAFGFEEWKCLRNPDVFLLKFTQDKTYVERIWNEKNKSRSKGGFYG